MILKNGTIKSIEVTTKGNLNSICTIEINNDFVHLQLSNNQIEFIQSIIGHNAKLYYTMENGKLALAIHNNQYSTICKTSKEKPANIEITLDLLIQHTIDDFRLKHSYGYLFLMCFTIIIPIYMFGIFWFTNKLNHFYRNILIIDNNKFF